MSDKTERNIRPGEVYARRGDWITCENGHVIAMFDRKVLAGYPFDESALVCWKQVAPKIGDPCPECFHCHAQFWKDNKFHFHDGWRVCQPSRGLTGAGWFKKLWHGLRRLG